MIFKHKDDVIPQLVERERLSRSNSLTKKQRDGTDDEIWKIRAGVKGEEQAAYHIDFHWKDRKNSVVLHDSFAIGKLP